ncbi:MAG: hypothetical protein HC828_03485 [Blastochloris sp.]|nr:hypothetical protein [Blastochloris sp.]
MQAIIRFWKRSVLNKASIIMSFSLIVCCCGWTGRIGSEPPQEPSTTSSLVSEYHRSNSLFKGE